MRAAAIALLSVSLPAILPSRADDAADAPKSQSFDSKGVSIHYTVQGKGEPVLLIHGLTASAQMNWGAPGIIRMLATNYQVIAMDVRGHGKSGKPAEDAAYGLELAEDVTRLLDRLQIKQAHLVGYSMGGMIIMKFLTLHPERVKSAALGGMGWLREGSALQNFWGRLPDRDGGGPGVPSALIRSLGALAVTEEQVKAIKVPVTVIVGANDGVRRLYVEPLQKVRADWPVNIVPNANHITCIFMPQFKTDLKNWLDSQSNKQP